MSNSDENNRIAVRTRKTRAHNLRLVRAFVFVIVLIIAFWGGFAIRGQNEFLQSLGFSSYVTGLSDKTVSTDAQKDTQNSISKRIAEVEDLLDSESLDEYNLDELTQIALNGFSSASNDSNLRYYSPARYEAILKSSSTGYAGIGVLFSEYEGKAYAVDVFEGSAAQASGVREGDFVVAIDGDRSQAWGMSEVSAALNRDEGSTVVVTWRRPSTLEAEGGTEFTTILTCKNYNVANVTTELDDGVGYIKVAQLTQSSAENVSTALSELQAQGATSFVLDLRDNPGGYLTQAVEIASLFMESGTVVNIHSKDGDSVKTATSQAAIDSKVPLVVLANSSTASAAEVVVAALKESQRASVVGTTTMGKGSVQVTHELTFGGAMRYTAAYYLTPLGHDIDGAGVSPTVTIQAETDSDDNQKSYAVEVARSLVVS